MEDLESIRKRIDEIDDQIIDLYKKRVHTSDDIAEYKKANNIPIVDRQRERAKLASMAGKVCQKQKPTIYALYSLLIEASKRRQREQSGEACSTAEEIIEAMQGTHEVFPQDAFIACQGVEGAYSQIATTRMFKHPSIMYFSNFEGVFRAVEQGLCTYGVLPLENSTAGSVNQVYDLMMRHNFHIVRSVRLKVDHCLLAKPGAHIEDVKHIYSHEQAIAQCGAYLEGLKDVQVHVCANTAEAAMRVSQSENADVAALSSRSCAEVYGLEALDVDVQDNGNNYTRFACIAKDLEIYPGADRTSLMLVTNHEPGALFKVLGSFYALDLNILKLESRPLPDRDFEFMFYFDLECPVAAPELAALIRELSSTCEELRYLGSYSEIV